MESIWYQIMTKIMFMSWFVIALPVHGTPCPKTSMDGAAIIHKLFLLMKKQPTVHKWRERRMETGEWQRFVCFLCLCDLYTLSYYKIICTSGPMWKVSNKNKSWFATFPHMYELFIDILMVHNLHWFDYNLSFI